MMGFLWATCANATLGKNEDSIEVDRTHFHWVNLGKVNQGSYNVITLKGAACTLREYTTPEGVIFGIAWTGYHHPDLEVLLGEYRGQFKSMSEAESKKSGRKKGKRHRTLHSEQLHVEHGGHMRNYTGKAYDPTLVPKDVKVEVIQ